jgi:DNA-binding response OmpR family regulator
MTVFGGTLSFEHLGQAHHPKDPTYLQTVHGIGYKFVD